MSEVRDRPLTTGDQPGRRTPAVPAAMPEAAVAAPVVAAPPMRARRGWLRPLLFLLLPVVLVIGGYEYVTGGATMSTENAYVRADMVSVSTDVSGIVKSVDVHENQRVKTGDVLFSLDDLPFRLALDRANANIGLVNASLDALKASYRDMQAQIRQAQVEVDFNLKDQDRQQRLVGNGASSVYSLETSQRGVQTARLKVAALTQQLAGIVANLGGDPDIDNAKHPKMLEAVATRDEAARQLRHTVVRAPMDGIVTNVPSLQPGQYLAAAGAAFSIVAADHMWVEANPKETELTWVRPGQDVDISVDTYPGQTWHGTVESISPASAGSFAMLPAQNTSGNWVKVVQRIPMRVRIDTPAGKPPLRAGMSVVLAVETGHVRGLPEFMAGWFGAKKGDAGHA
jgi:membrane fusion protein (multidrug efflux system)